MSAFESGVFTRAEALIWERMLLALELGRHLDVPLPTTAVTNEFLTAARGLDLTELDFAAVFHVLAKLSGVTP